MTCHQEIHAVLRLHILPKRCVIATRKVRDHDLPSGSGLSELLIKPCPLSTMGIPEPRIATLSGRHASIVRAACAASVMPTTNVVILVFPWALRVKCVGVVHKDLHGVVRVLYLLAEIPRGHDPIVIQERVPDLLRPTFPE